MMVGPIYTIVLRRLLYSATGITIEVQTHSWVGSAQFLALNVNTAFHSAKYLARLLLNPA